MNLAERFVGRFVLSAGDTRSAESVPSEAEGQSQAGPRSAAKPANPLATHFVPAGISMDTKTTAKAVRGRSIDCALPRSMPETRYCPGSDCRGSVVLDDRLAAANSNLDAILRASLVNSGDRHEEAEPDRRHHSIAPYRSLRPTKAPDDGNDLSSNQVACYR